MLPEWQGETHDSSDLGWEGKGRVALAASGGVAPVAQVAQVAPGPPVS